MSGKKNQKPSAVSRGRRVAPRASIQRRHQVPAGVGRGFIIAQQTPAEVAKLPLDFREVFGDHLPGDLHLPGNLFVGVVSTEA